MIGTPMLGTFEKRMLDKMGHSFIGFVLVTAADIDINARISHSRPRAAQYYLDTIV